MADAIPNYFQTRFSNLDNTCSTYKLTITNVGDTLQYLYPPSRTNGSPPMATQSGEIIIELDWSALSGDLDDSYASTSNVAYAVTEILMATDSFPELNGHPAIELPIHLVGHSRGGSLISQISYVLGTNGIWVDHLTSLDPYPFNNDGNFDYEFTSIVDAPAQYTYENVLFADNYWQDIGVGAPIDPDGEPVNGAYVRQLESLSGGYANVTDFGVDHENVHLWYHGTVDLETPTSDTEATITDAERTTWWVKNEQEGTNAGFEYSLIGRGDRMSSDAPLGPGYPAIVDGYNQRWDLGAGASANRTALPSNKGTWPNLIKFDVTGTNVVRAGESIDTTLYYQYAGNSNLTLSIYFDDDFNPYNTNSVLIYQAQPASTGAGSVYHYSTLSVSTANVPAGVHAIYGRISDGVHSRYLYAPELVEVLPSQQPSLEILKINGSQIVISVSGVIGQSILLESSPDLRTWSPLVTNRLTSVTWNYTNNPQQAVSEQYYRALLVP